MPEGAATTTWSAGTLKTGQSGEGDHRLWRGVGGCNGTSTRAAARSQSLGQACEPYREVIDQALSHGRNAMAIWQELVDTCGFAAEYKSVNRFVRKLRGSQSP